MAGVRRSAFGIREMQMRITRTPNSERRTPGFHPTQRDNFVRVNKDSRGWIVVCLLILAGAAGLYVAELQASAAHAGPSGGSWYGLVFGSVGFAMMLFALLLGLKKRLRTMRIGRAYHWMQGHVWFGLLSYPLILFHCGFRWGDGIMTQTLMWMFTVVIVTGILGLIIQQYMPAKLLREVQFETIYDQIEHVVAQLRTDADELMKETLSTSNGEAFEMEVVPAGGQTSTVAETNVMAARTLNDFYKTHVQPFMADVLPIRTKLRTESGARVAFDQVRGTLPNAMHEALDDLASIVEERRQLAHQKRMHHILHTWLLVHVPLSYALMLLATWHAVFALRFVW